MSRMSRALLVLLVVLLSAAHAWAQATAQSKDAFPLRTVAQLRSPRRDRRFAATAA